jgi:endonuclease/exonuclease/phosphatase (EEP) superfamily protein YafD
MARRFLGYPFFELLFATLIACVLLSMLLITVRGYLTSPSNVPERASGSQPQEPIAKRTESPALPGSSPTTIVIRIATYNINFGNTFGDDVLSAIAEARADILFLQETTLQSEAFLQPQLASWYPHFHAAGHQGRYAAERFVFASKYPLQDITFTPPEHGLFGSHTARCVIAGNEITLVNVHLTPVTLSRTDEAETTSLLSALWGTETAHAAEIKAICARLDLAQPTILAGDFNSLSTFAAPGHLRELGLVDSFASVHDDAEAHPTWFWPTRPVPLRARIDYVFHSSHFRTMSSQVIPRDGSDHYLLVSELQLAPLPPRTK